ncbi:MAG: NUDIX domain-containing protein [Candidatus Aenigmarchaeota archaeon]|nr:NUDIX domain-containing protein [Candidatus Aenigmarchaeota archaeon]MCK5373530.1 NUDIX domain-containing protein [Candidatus Aenigmarchaeota archaeon]MCK5452578.1 NUDIX domain-containing protein [Candidatus Aenigmarchaeota archaeon]
MNTANIIIVDDDDNIICHKQRGKITHSDIYRVSALWIQNSKGDILLAKRAYTKKHRPGKWGPAVAGTNDKGETYRSNIIKEAEEEIGLTGHNFKEFHNVRFKGKHNFFCQWYFAVVNKKLTDFKLQEEEVAEIRWFKKDELIIELKNNPDGLLYSVKYFINSEHILENIKENI